MKLYKFTMNAIVAASDSDHTVSLEECHRQLKEKYERLYYNTVLMDDMMIKLELVDETTLS